MSLMLLPGFFFFNDTATTEIYTLSLHDALPISTARRLDTVSPRGLRRGRAAPGRDRKSTRLNSSHTVSSYAVFCLKKKKHTGAMALRARRRDCLQLEGRSHRNGGDVLSTSRADGAHFFRGSESAALFFYRYGHHRDLPSFPTRRSSD